MLKYIKTILICIIAEILNFAATAIFYHTLKIPLFFDTIFTVAVVFYCVLVPALCVSIGYNLINSLIWIYSGGVSDPFIFFHSICGILIVLSTWIFALISSGIIDYFHYIYYDIPDMMYPIKSFTESFLSQRFSLLTSCILAQIPISFADRLIATFAGYGIYLTMEHFIGRK